MRTSADYETLRHYATEGGETHEAAISDLAVFVTRGAAAWLHSRLPNQCRWRAMREMPGQSGGLGMLAVLLANMIESGVGL